MKNLKETSNRQRKIAIMSARKSMPIRRRRPMPTYSSRMAAGPSTRFNKNFNQVVLEHPLPINYPYQPQNGAETRTTLAADDSTNSNNFD